MAEETIEEQLGPGIDEEDDGTLIVTLDVPIQIFKRGKPEAAPILDKEIKTLHLKHPTAAHLLNIDDITTPVRREIALLGQLTGTSTAHLRELRAADYHRCSKAMSFLMGKSRPTGETSSEQ